MRSFFQQYHFKRKFFHFCLGIFIVFILNINYLDIYVRHILLGMLIISLILSMIVKYLKPNFLITMLKHFDKPEDIISFPAKGAIYYLVGAVVTVFLFRIEIASASLLILTFGDPAAFIVGKYYGKKKIIINKEKLLEGTLAGVFLGTAAASIFVPFPVAFFGAAFGMMAEAIELKYLKLDDNFFIPFVSGLIMTIIYSLI
jgi:dolichol kinase